VNYDEYHWGKNLFEIPSVSHVLTNVSHGVSQSLLKSGRLRQLAIDVVNDYFLYSLFSPTAPHSRFGFTTFATSKISSRS
jgi:hypothetical protein